jgi:hypothetical protein
MAVSLIRPLLLIFCLVTVASMLAPAPKWVIPSRECIVPLIAGAAVFAVAAMTAMLGALVVAFDLALLGATALMPAFWLARAPFPRGDGNDDADGGGGGGAGGSRPPRSGPPTGGVDWEAFDRARARWGGVRAPASARVLVATGSGGGSER